MSDHRTPADLEAEIARQRDELAETVDQLTHKLDVKTQAKERAAAGRRPGHHRRRQAAARARRPPRSPRCCWSASSSGGADDEPHARSTESRTQDRTPDVEDDRLPDSPTDLTRRSWRYVLRRTVREFGDDHCTDLAAALTYYAVLALFPAAIALISLLGVVGQGQSSVDNIIEVLQPLVSSSTLDTIQPALESIATSQRRRTRPRGRRARCALVGLRVRRRVRSRDEHRVRDRRGPPVLEAAPADAPGHPGRRSPGRRRAGDARRLRSARVVDRLGDRAERPGRDRLEHREVAGDRAVRRGDRRDPLLRDPEREAAEVPLAVDRRGRRDPGVDPRVGGVRAVRRDLRQLQQDLRLARRRRGRVALAVDHQPGPAVRRRSSTPSSSVVASCRPGIAAEEELQLPARDTRGITKARRKEQKDLAAGRAIREQADDSRSTHPREKTS